MHHRISAAVFESSQQPIFPMPEPLQGNQDPGLEPSVLVGNLQVIVTGALLPICPQTLPRLRNRVTFRTATTKTAKGSCIAKASRRPKY